MAIIPPSRKFEGSELNLAASSAPYIKDGVRKALFNKNNNQEGAYLYFLPSYRVDSAGNGVWFKKITVRDNFGTNFKEKYYVPNKVKDPAEHFAFNFRQLYPEEARVKDVEVNGRKFKQYPSFGRATERVLYNVAFAQNLGTGAHVLDLPLRNGADILMNWLDGRDMRGNLREPINQPNNCFPVFVRLKDNSANPWMLQVDTSQAVALPEQLADSDYLYNLDEILVEKSKEEIIDKLRDMYPDVFDECMENYAGLTRRSVAVNQPAPQSAQPIQPPVQQPQPQPVVALNIPKATITAPSVPVNAPAVADISSLPPNPMMNNSRLSREEALRFINQE